MNPVTSAISPLSVDSLASGISDVASDPRNVEAIGVEFESVFLSMMIKEMRNTLEKGGFFGEESSDTYGGMFDLFIGKHLAQSKPLGISELLLQNYSKSSQQVAGPESAEQNPPTSFTA